MNTLVRWWYTLTGHEDACCNHEHCACGKDASCCGEGDACRCEDPVEEMKETCCHHPERVKNGEACCQDEKRTG